MFYKINLNKFELKLNNKIILFNLFYKDLLKFYYEIKK